MRLKDVEQIHKGAPGSDIGRIMAYHPELFGASFGACIQQFLRGPSDWTVGERELFASFTASRLHCVY
ncbi:hypothetical protein KTT_56490 [Tengunoibacter tsumagoiensis]|uniref:Carboxymuconolactone decarboxylase-like domain-containing protein n=2 Tax=Tengunoibacter tsumagoiensis TaxID=2014871 RepID=A0A402A9H0_9CHLR|nr:hypothetical protein KTT_56490 [Tengunoibacter tsumagoiensis]